MFEKRLSMTFPELALVGVTRGAIGVGVGLLLANKLSRDKRTAIGLPLFLLGALSSIPIAIRLFHEKNKKADL